MVQFALKGNISPWGSTGSARFLQHRKCVQFQFKSLVLHWRVVALSGLSLKCKELLDFIIFYIWGQCLVFQLQQPLKKKNLKLSFCYKLVGGRADHPLTRRLVVYSLAAPVCMQNVENTVNIRLKALRRRKKVLVTMGELGILFKGIGLLQ